MFLVKKSFALRSKSFLFFCVGLFTFSSVFSQRNYEAKSFIYNTLIGGISSGIGALINKHKDEKPLRAFTKGFTIGCGGGAVMYAGKKSNILIARQKNIGYAWLSRGIFSAGNSIVENASANRLWYSQWHYDLGFVRLELKTNGKTTLIPKLLPSAFGAFAFTALHGHLNAIASLECGTFIFENVKISYAPYLVGSTTGNNVLFVDSLRTTERYHEVFAHEMVHTCQFQELSGFNYYFNPLTTRWKEKSSMFRKISKYVYGDINYELMLINYFFVQGSIIKNRYCSNFLENEAEVLTTGRISCP
ncbi:hypothetical protein CNR22_05895 [Sphingobacteriaceae bacterium]|nr:hypothetical protein CNR22_05895 [Sphingobacteriaceae bacterium]